MEALQGSALRLGGEMGEAYVPSAPAQSCSLAAQSAKFENSSARNILVSNSKYPSFQDYVWKEGDRPRVPHNGFSQASDLPVVDFSVFRASGDSPTRKLALRNLTDATKEWGFFQLTNHGVDLGFIAKVEKLARKMFALPPERKIAALCKPLSSDGYACGALGSNILGNQASGTRVENISWHEAFHFPQTPEVIDSFTNLLFPGGDEEFRSGINDYFTLMEAVGRQVIELLTEGLGCKPDSLTFKDGVRIQLRNGLRLHSYPPYPNPELTLGLVPHTDPTLITILHQDSVGGLQIDKDGQWVAVRPRPDSLIVNIGDPFQVYSNDIYKSVLHRAVVNSSQERFSMALFMRPPMDAHLAPLPELLEGKDNPYKPFTYAEYRKANLENKMQNRNNLSRFLATNNSDECSH